MAGEPLIQGESIMYPLLRVRRTHGLRLALSVVVGVLAAAAASCASMRVSSYLAKDADLARYHSYTWAPSDRLSTGDPRLDNNPFFQERLQSSVDRQLGARGFAREAVTSPDLVVHYHASVSQELDVNNTDREFGHCDAGDCRPLLYEAGTIVVDLVDARTNKLVWRGWANDSIDGVIDNQDWLEDKIDQAVNRIMQQLPRSGLTVQRSS